MLPSCRIHSSVCDKSQIVFIEQEQTTKSNNK